MRPSWQSAYWHILFNIGNSGDDKTHGPTNGLDVIFKICDSSHECYQNISELFEFYIVEIRARTIGKTKIRSG